MKPTQSHLNTAQRIYDRLGRGSVADIDALAAALVAAHQDGIREGKRQAADTAAAVEVAMPEWADPEWAEIAHRQFDAGAAVAQANIIAAILSTITDESE